MGTGEFLLRTGLVLTGLYCFCNFILMVLGETLNEDEDDA